MVYSLDFDDIADLKLHFFNFVILQDGGSKIHHQLVGVAAILRPLDRHSCYIYITNLLRLNRKWITYNRGSNDNFKFSWINYFPTCHNGFRKRLLSIDVRFPSINAKQAIGNIVNMIRKQD